MSAFNLSSEPPIPEDLLEQFRSKFGKYKGGKVTLYVYGASANPMHVAHAKIAKFFSNYIQDRENRTGEHGSFIAIPAFINLLKLDIQPFEHRMQMADNLLGVDPNIFLSDLERAVFRNQIATNPKLIEFLAKQHGLQVLTDDADLTTFLKQFNTILPDKAHPTRGLEKCAGLYTWQEIGLEALIAATENQTLNTLNYIRRIGPEIGVDFEMHYVLGLDNARDIVQQVWKGAAELQKFVKLDFVWREIPGTKISGLLGEKVDPQEMIIAALSKTWGEENIKFHRGVYTFDMPDLDTATATQQAKQEVEQWMLNISSTEIRKIVSKLHTLDDGPVYKQEFAKLAEMVGEKNANYILQHNLYVDETKDNVITNKKLDD